MGATEQFQEHTGSYYAATVNEHDDYPALAGAQTADVCIVGGGFTGVSTALTLAERGYSVVVVEANRVGWGASGRNGGQLIGGITGESKLAKMHGDGVRDMLWDLRWRGHEIIHERVEKYGIDCDLKNGFIDVALKPRHLRDLEEGFEELQKRNFPYEYRLTDREETRELTGTDAYLGGLINMRDGHLHPLNLCRGEAQAAAGLGVRIFEQSPVIDIRHGEKPRVSTAQGHVDAKTVVLAGNAYHALESRALSGMTFPAGSYIIATEPLDEDLANELNPQDLAICDLNEVVDYYRMSGDRRLLFGGRCNYSGREPRSIQKTMVPRMLDIYPQLAGKRIEYEWGGKIGIVINRIQMMGCIDGNIWYSQGYCGHGVNATHIASEVLADAIGGTMEKFDVFGNVRHWRVPLGQWFGNQMVALGMIYYRLRDML